MESSSPLPDRLLDYLILVGPGPVTCESILPSPTTPRCVETTPLQSWDNITGPIPTILRHFPGGKNQKFELANDVVYFCQPEGCCVELPEPKTHVFMLTDTETNIQTYGVCLMVPHLFDPHLTQLRSETVNGTGQSDPISIQEWGILSVCILSHHPFFNFFAKCLKTLAHFMQHFGSNELSWNELLRSHSASGMEPGPTKSGESRKVRGHQKKSTFIVEVENWISNLLLLPAPEAGRFGLEVELEVEPEVFVCYPPKNRFPLLDLHICQLFQRVGVHTFIEIFKLILSEQKVIYRQVGRPSFTLWKKLQ